MGKQWLTLFWEARQRMKWLDGIANSMDMSLGKLGVCGRPGVLRSMGLQRVGHDWATELNWTNTWVQMFSLNPLSIVTNKLLGTDKGSWYSKLRKSLVCCSFLPHDTWWEDVGSPRGEFSSPICSGNFSELWNERKRSWSHPQEYCTGKAAPCFL